MLSKKFKATASAGVISAAMFAAYSLPASVLRTEAARLPEGPAYRVLPEQCMVVDRDTRRYQADPFDITYNFRMGAVIFNTGLSGEIAPSSEVMPMKDLAEDGQARAQELYAKLPASANCKPPKFQ
ncbi:MAG: hypothetical protein ACAH83_08225 [Alphaproteobacteria bacterium]